MKKDLTESKIKMNLFSHSELAKFNSSPLIIKKSLNGFAKLMILGIVFSAGVYTANNSSKPLHSTPQMSKLDISDMVENNGMQIEERLIKRLDRLEHRLAKKESELQSLREYTPQINRIPASKPKVIIPAKVESSIPPKQFENIFSSNRIEYSKANDRILWAHYFAELKKLEKNFKMQEDHFAASIDLTVEENHLAFTQMKTNHELQVKAYKIRFHEKRIEYEKAGYIYLSQL